MNSKTDRLAQIIEKLLEKVEIDGLCGFFVVKDEEENDGTPSINHKIQVILILDIDYLDNEEIDQYMFARKVKSNIYKKIQGYLGVDVYVGSIAKKCDNIWHKQRKNQDL